MNTGHYSPGDIVISSDSYVTRDYCVNTNSDGYCIEWIKVVPADSLQVQNLNNAQSNSNVLMFGGVVFLLIWIVKGIFRLIFPGRGKK